MRSAQLVGRLGRDAELKYTPNGTPVCKFSIAVDAGKKNDEKITMWVNCTLWAKRAETLAPYLLKGKLIAIEANLDPARAFLNKQNEAQASLEVTVQNLTFCGGGERSESEGGSTPAQKAEAARAARARESQPTANVHDQYITDDDIPF